MDKKEETIYCGSGKVMNPKWLKVTINPTKIADYIQEYNGNKFIKLNINLKDEADQYGKDVSISVDTCLLYTSPSPRDRTRSRMPSSA